MNSLMLKFRFMKGMNEFLFIPNIVTNMCSKEGEITTSLERMSFQILITQNLKWDNKLFNLLHKWLNA